MDNDINKYVLSKLDSQHQISLINFLGLLQQHNDHKTFHPHEFDNQSIEKIIKLSRSGPDEYWILEHNNEILAYGLLRGWSEGFTIPSIGLAVSPNYRGLGLGEQMMLFLHARAKDKGCDKIRLTVYKDNISAIKLYHKLGYVLEDYSDLSLIGFINL